MSYPRNVKYKFGKEVQQAASNFLMAYNSFVQLKAMYAKRTWGTGGADAIVDADLNPGDTTIGADLGITAAQINAFLNYAGNQITNLMNGAAVTPYPVTDAINDIRSDI